MNVSVTIVGGVPIPSTDPAFLALIGVHVLLGLAATVAGIVAMFSPKRPGRHPGFGSVYFWCLCGVVVSASLLSAVRWSEDYRLFILGTLAFAAAWFGRLARRKRWGSWARLHITGMGVSYIFLLTAFYVDNGKNLPLWRNLPSIVYWVLPAAVGIPIIFRALLWHPVVHASRLRQSP